MNIAQCIARCSDPYRAAATSHSYRKELYDLEGLHIGVRFVFEDESILTFKVSYELDLCVPD